MRKNTYLFISGAAIALFLIVVSACEVLGLKGDEKDLGNIAKMLTETTALDNPEPTVTPEEVSPSADETDGDFVCTVKRMRASVEFSEMFALDPQTDIIWPGSILDGNTILNGQYTPISLKRGPLTISTSFPSTGGSKSATVKEAKLSSVRDAIADIMSAEITGSTPAKLNFTAEQVYEESQLKLAIGYNYSGAASVKALFNFENKSVKQRVVAKFIQVYYSIDVDLPASPTDFFDSNVSESELDRAMNGDVSPMYVSSIQYGRMALFSFESSMRSIDLKLAVEAAYGNQSGTLDVQYQNILKNSTIKLMVLGGDGEAAVQAVDGYEEFMTYVKAGGNFSATSPGVPLGYKLRYLKDNAIGNVVLTSEYSVRNCNRLGGSYKVSLKRLQAGNNQDDGIGFFESDQELEIFGEIYITATVTGEGATVSSPTTENLVCTVPTTGIANSSGTVALSASRNFTFAGKPDLATSGIKVEAHFQDYDAGSANDDLGTKSTTVYLSEIEPYKEYSVTPFGDGFYGLIFEIIPLE